MMKARRSIIVFGFLISAMAGNAQTVAPPYEVGTWQGFRTATVSYTFDDGSPNQYAKALPMFNELGFKLTWFIVTSPTWSWPANWTALQNAAAQGHEIASHTVTHASLGGLSDSLQTVELKNSRDEINAHILGRQCVTMAYPYCVSGKKSICEQYYMAARICSGSIVPRTPGDFMNISSIICGDQGGVRTAQNFNNTASSAISTKGWCVYLIHGIDGDGGWSSVQSSELRAGLEYLKANNDKFWVSTFGNVARYIKERNAVSVAETSVRDTSIVLRVTDNLPDSVYDVPVTLRRPLPQGWSSALITQNGRVADAQIVEVNSIQYIQFDAVPDDGDVVITKSEASGVQIRGGLGVPLPMSYQNYPNPFNPSTTIEFSLPERSEVRMVLVNSSGQVVKELAAGSFAAGTHQINLDASGLSSGVYYYQLRAGKVFETKKLVLAR